MDVQAVSLLVPIWVVNVSIVELVGVSQVPAVGQSAPLGVLVIVSLQPRTGTADAYKVLLKDIFHT